MIVTDDMVEAALSYLNMDPHPYAVAEYKLAEAKNGREKRFAELYSKIFTDGTVRDRECAVECDASYQQAKLAEARAIRELAAHKARRVWADKITDLYQTVSANQRYAERIR